MRGASPKTTIRRALAHREFRRVVTAFGISTAGDWLYGVAISAYVFDRTGSPAWVAVSAIVRLTPYVLFGALAGVIADRFDRRLVMIISDVVRTILMLWLALVAIERGSVPLAVAIAFLSTAAGTPSRAALAGLTPMLVPERDLAAANGAMSILEHVAVAVGPAAGAALIILGSPGLAFLVNALTFVASALLLLGVPRGRRPRTRQRTSFARRLVIGVAAVRESKGIGAVLFVVVVASFNWGETLVLLILVSDHLLGTGAAGLGFLYAFIGIGGIIGGLLAGRLLARGSAGALIGSLALIGAAFALLGEVHDTRVAYSLAILIGGAGTILDVSSITAMQRALSEDVRSRVFGITDSMSVSALLIGTFLAPVLVRELGLREALVASGVILPLLGLAVMGRLRAFDQRLNDRVAAQASVSQLLRSTELFDGAPPGVIEAMAASAKRVLVPAGSVLFRQGDPADAVYIVGSGDLEVIVAGPAGDVVIASCSDRDYVGEIGVFEGIPRTASVRATQLTELWSISADNFLELVSGVPSTSEILRRRIAERLAARVDT